MFRDMRRIKQLLSKEDTIAVLQKGTSGVLALSGDDGYPYAVPISYVFDSDKIFFHCAATGHKIDSIKRCNKVSFCVIDKDTIVPEKFTTFFRSVIVFGTMKILAEENEKRSALEKIARKYSPDENDESRNKEIDGAMNHVCILELTIDHMTGKEAIELVNTVSTNSSAC